MKSLEELANERASLAGDIYLTHARGFNLDSPIVKSFLFSKLFDHLLGIKVRVIKDANAVAHVYIVDMDNLNDLETVKVTCSVDRLRSLISDSLKSLVDWAREHTLFHWQSQVTFVMGNAFGNYSSFRLLEKFLSNEIPHSFSEIQREASQHNHCLAIGMLNLFPRDRLEQLPASLLCPTFYFFHNPSLLYTNHLGWNQGCIDQLRNAFALSLYQESAALVWEKIERTVDELEIAMPAVADGTNDSSILNLLSIISLSQHDAIARKLIAKIDATNVDLPLKEWIVMHFGGSRAYTFLSKHMKEAGWDMPEVARPIQTRMLCRAMLNNQFVMEVVGDHMFFYPKHKVEMYKIRSDISYDTEDALAAVCDANVGICRARLDVTESLVAIIFPTGTRVTPVMIDLLKRWALNYEMLEDEERLARLILLVDQVSIIRHN